VSAPEVRVSLDRTAVWVGDRVTYSVHITSPRGFDVLDDDLVQDKLKLEGLEVVATDTSRVEHPDGGVTRRFDYVLTSYKVDVPVLKIAPMSVRYFATRPGQRLEDAAAAGEVQVPGAVVAFRSVLPEQAELALRDVRTPADRPSAFAMAQPVGIALIVVSIVPVAIWAVALAGRARAKAATRSRRQARREERASLEAARALDVADPEERRRAYALIDGIVRDHLRDATGAPGRSLTPAEVSAALAGRRSRIPAESVVALLAECETARYGPPSALPSADACRDALAEAERVVAGLR
jgi:hypothetical protein